MQKMTWFEAKEYLKNYNKQRGYTSKGTMNEFCRMVAVISEDTFTQPYTLEERSYEFTNDNKAFLDNLGYSIFATSLDGTDFVRLENYLADEGNKDGWKVEYCYIKQED